METVFKMEIYEDGLAKVWVKGEELLDVSQLSILARPQDYNVQICQYARGEDGGFDVRDDKIRKKYDQYHFGGEK